MDISGASTNIIRVSLWVKERSGQSGNIDLQIYQQVSGTIINLGGPGFNPATGVIVTHTHSSDEKVVEYHNGWYRIAFTMTTPSGNFTSSTRIDLQNSEHYVWGIQVEAATFETSYIPTSGSTVTRARDYAKITGTNFSDFYNKDEGTLFVNYKLDKSNYLYSPVGVDMVKFEADGNSGGYNIRIVSNASTPQLDVHGVDNGAAQFDMVGINLSDGLKDYFVAQAFALNDLAVSFNGAAPQTDTSVTVVEWDKLYIGTTPRRAHYKSVKYYPKRLPNAQLQGLTQQ